MARKIVISIVTPVVLGFFVWAIASPMEVPNAAILLAIIATMALAIVGFN